MNTKKRGLTGRVKEKQYRSTLIFYDFDDVFPAIDKSKFVVSVRSGFFFLLDT